jgi:hypothetical protein
MKSERPRHHEETGRVLRFEPRRPTLRVRTPLSAVPSPVEDLSKYARSDEDRDDDRHRMKTNMIALVVLALLIGCGYWLFDTIVEMRRNQDCALSGRTNCVHLSIPADAR